MVNNSCFSDTDTATNAITIPITVIRLTFLYLSSHALFYGPECMQSIASEVPKKEK